MDESDTGYYTARPVERRTQGGRSEAGPPARRAQIARHYPLTGVRRGGRLRVAAFRRNALQFPLTPAGDGNAGVMAQLACPVAVAIPLHLSLVDGQNVASVPGGRDDVAFPDFLFEMRPRDGDVLVIGIVRLGLLLDDRPFRHGRAESERPNHRAHN